MRDSEFNPRATHTHVNAHTRLYNVHTHVHTHMHMHVYTYTHTHTSTSKLFPISLFLEAVFKCTYIKFVGNFIVHGWSEDGHVFK